MTALMYVAVAIIGLAALAAAVARPRLVLLMLVTLDVANLNGVVEQDTGFSPYRAELVVAVLAVIVLALRHELRLAWSVVHLAVLVLLACCALTLLNTADLATSLSVFADRARGVSTWAIVFVLALSTRSLGQLVRGVVAVLAVLAAITVFHEYVLHNAGDLFGLSSVPLVQEGGALTPRHAGTSTDVNFWARLLILVLPFALSLAAMARGTLRTAAWIVGAVALLFGVYLTQSRGGFIAVFVAVVLWAILAGGRYRKSLLALPVVLVLLLPVLGGRLGTLFGVQAQSTVFADESVVTRARFQVDALHMFLDSPILGHGIGSFPALFPSYDRTSNFYSPVTIVPAAHNFYLEQLADGGVVLLLAWLLLFGSMIFVSARALIVMGPAPRNGERMLAVGVIASVVGWMAASVFLHLSDFRSVLAIAAIAALLDVRYRRRTPAPLPVRYRPVSRVPLVAVGVLALAGVIGTSAALLVTPPRYEATAMLGVVRASDAVDGADAYALDVVSRGPLPATFAAVVDSALSSERVAEVSGFADASVAASQSRLGGAVQVVAFASDPAQAEQLAQRAGARAASEVAALGTGYALRGSTGAAQEVRPGQVELVLGDAGSLILLGGIVVGLIRSRRRRAEPGAASRDRERLLVRT